MAEINHKPGGTGAPKNSLQRHRETLASTHDLDPSERVTVVVWWDVPSTLFLISRLVGSADFHRGGTWY